MTAPKEKLANGQWFALFIALLALVGLVIRLVITGEREGSYLHGVSFMYQYFTIWGNTLVLILMATLASGRRVPNTLMLATVVTIMGIGIIFHALLSQWGAREGWDGLANQITHTYIPILAPLWWLVHGKRGEIQWKSALKCLIIPAVYCLYALIRAEFSGFYPYGFIDLSKLGWAGLIKSVSIITLAFFILSLLTIGAVKLRDRVPQCSRSAT